MPWVFMIAASAVIVRPPFFQCVFSPGGCQRFRLYKDFPFMRVGQLPKEGVYLCLFRVFRHYRVSFTLLLGHNIIMI
jgi:hypothetical protein